MSYGKKRNRKKPLTWWEKEGRKRPWHEKVQLNIRSAETLLELLETGSPWELENHKLFQRLELRGMNDYSEPGYCLQEGQKAVLVGNWNKLSHAGFDLLEKRYALEWCDEWGECSDGTAVRTQPDCMQWSPSYWLVEGEIYSIPQILEDPNEYLQNVEPEEVSESVLQEILNEGLPEGWELLDDWDNFNGNEKRAVQHYEDEGFERVLTYRTNCYSIRWILGYKEEEEEEIAC